MSGAVKPWEFRPQGIMHNGVYVVWTGSDARMYALDATKRQIEALPLLVAALSALVDAAPTALSCDDFHHPKADQGHGYGLDDCGPRNRYFAAIAAAEKALAALRGDDAAEGVQS